MPIKRRTSKSRELTDGKIRELHYGPGTEMLAGAGYWHGDFYWTLTPDAQAEIVAEMRDDWHRHSDRVLRAWEARSEHDLYIADTYHAGQRRPWAAEQFGEPPCR